MSHLTTEQKLEQAQHAYHQLLTGQKKVSVRYGETSVQYTQTNIGELRQYIAELQAALGITPTTTRGEPFQVQW